MLKKSKRILAIALAVLMTTALAACGSPNNGEAKTPPTTTTSSGTEESTTTQADHTSTETETTTETTVEAKEEQPTESYRDLDGMEITLGNWWGDWDTNTYEPKTAADEALLEWRIKIQEDLNCTIREVKVADWSEMQELVATSFLAGDPVASAVIVEPSWFVSINNQGLFYPISDTGIDFSSMDTVKWNQNTAEATTKNGKIYGFSVGEPEGGGVFFNKRLFEEAGIDPEEPYNMQKAGTWTWDAFIDLCRKVTRDTNNDGINDTYALATFSSDTLALILASNGAQFVEKDESGKFFNASDSPEYLQALQFAIRLNEEGFLMPQPEGTEWNWFEDAFLQGQAAMRCGGKYLASGFAENMTDDLGYVLFPKGPKCDDYRFYTSNNIYGLPATMSEQEANDVMYALSYWFREVPGYDGPDDWKTNEYSNFRDSRAVDETCQYFHNGGINSIQPYHVFIPGFDTGTGMAWSIWQEGADAAQLIESVAPSWNSVIDDVNR